MKHNSDESRIVGALSAAALLACLWTGVSLWAAVVVPTTGSRFEGSLVAASADGQITFATDDTSRSMPLAEVVSWGALVEPSGGTQVLLVDGGLIVVDTVRTENESLHIESEVLGPREIPLEFVAGVIFQPPRELQRRDRLANRVRETTARSDRLLLENGDELTGTVTTLGAMAVTIETSGQKIAVELTRIAAVAFDPTLAPAVKSRGLRLLIGLRDGSRLVVTGLLVDQGKLQLTLPDKSVWALPPEAVVYLQPLNGKAKYLSDLTSEAYRHLPFLSQSWPFQNDLNVLGTQLRAAGHPYVKGIGMHSAARLTYRLDNRYRAFEADVALDDQVGSGGAAVFAVYVDDKLAWKSDVVRGGAAPVPVKVDTTGGKRISLLVEFAERGDELDHANWLDARLVD